MTDHVNDHETTQPHVSAQRAASEAREASDERAPADEALAALLRDLTTLHSYLEERSQHTYTLAQRFLVNARRDSSSRAYDERQAAMLEYQHYIWSEIAARLDKLLMAYEAYGPPSDMRAEAPAAAPATGEDE